MENFGFFPWGYFGYLIERKHHLLEERILTKWRYREEVW